MARLARLHSSVRCRRSPAATSGLAGGQYVVRDAQTAGYDRASSPYAGAASKPDESQATRTGGPPRAGSPDEQPVCPHRLFVLFLTIKFHPCFGQNSNISLQRLTMLSIRCD